jgi:hypothetical protein
MRRASMSVLFVATIVLGAAHRAPAATPGTWQSVGSMSVGRHFPLFPVRLLDGRVLVAGGWDGGAFPGGILASTDIFNPTTDLWSPAAVMSIPRHLAAATILNDGRVLVVGGNTPQGIVATAEIYDPVTGFWTSAASMKTPRVAATATLLADGKVLVVGGANDLSNFGLHTAEIYSPDANVWTETSAMAFAHSSHHAILLQDGRVLVVAGFTLDDAGNPQPDAAAEIFDPVSEHWSSAGALAVSRINQGAVLMQDGRVMVAGGDHGGSNGYLSSVEIYDPGQNAWSQAAPMSSLRNGISLLTLANGEVLVVGGISVTGLTATAETYNPQTDTWSPTSSAQVPRYYYAITQLLDGRVLVAGGCCEPQSPYGRSSVETFTPAFGCPADVTAQVDVFRFAFHWIPFTPFRFQWVIIHNKTTAPIVGPLAYVMDDLQNAVFIGSPSKTSCFSPEGDPFTLVSVGGDNVLSPNESRLKGLWFFKTGSDRITYTPHVLSGIPTE